ncbi:MAG: PAQR family membrane homeostasis protein TrhA [Culicoidibacterales bacterium]
MTKFLREPINSLTHLGGAAFGVLALILMLTKQLPTTSFGLSTIAIIVFGVSLILLYGTSGIYHAIFGDDARLYQWRRLDHSMIFVLIAGSYAPFCLITLNNPAGWGLFASVTSLAVIGIIFKLVWFNCPRWLSTAIYIIMGWSVIFLVSPLMQALATPALILLVAGGIFYTIGGIIYAIKPNFLKVTGLGFHEIFHIFTLLGSISHFLCVYFFVIN